MNKYYISTDSGSMGIEAKNLKQAIITFGYCPKWVEEAIDFEEWLTGIGGYGFITENDVEIARIRA